MTDRPRPVDRSCAAHYLWGQDCDGWRLLDHPALSVIEERVPPGGAEQRHVHSRARQFFYVLSGTGTIECEGTVVELRTGQGVQIPPGTSHRFVNRSDEDVRFLVISAPSTLGDRTDPGSAPNPGGLHGDFTRGAPD